MYSTEHQFFWTFLFIGFIFSSLAQALSVTRGPYLQLGTENAMTVRWRTDNDSDSVVRYGTNTNNLNQTASVSGDRSNHEVRINNLAPSTLYYYSVGKSSGAIAGGDNSYRFRTSPPSGSSKNTRIWLIGDSGTANSNAAAVYNTYMDYTGAEDTDLWIMLGDNAYRNGTDSEYQKAVFDMYPELLRRTPLWPTLGNHDGVTADSASESGPYYDIFSLPRNAEAGGLASGTEAYYSFNYGDIHFICLDSYETSRSADGAMLTWLKNDLLATDKNWIIAFWHHPPYSKGSHNSDIRDALIEMRENALPILESYGVDMVFTGHSHSYERSFLIDGHYDLSNTFNSSHRIDGGDGREDGDGVYQKNIQSWNAGTIYTVAGASGKIQGGPLNHPAMFSSLNELGSVVLDVTNNRIEAVHLRSDGRVTDYFTLTKGNDSTAPTLTEVKPIQVDQLTVSFDESIDVTSAENSENYSIDEDIDVLSAAANGNSVTLTTTSFALNSTYTLKVNNIADIDDNVIAPNSQSTFNFQNTQFRSFQDGVFPTNAYKGTEDTYVSGNNNINYGSSRTLNTNNTSGDRFMTLIKWDISSIPAGATILKAQIEVEVFNPSDQDFDIYTGITSWSEDDATGTNIPVWYSNIDVLIGTLVPSSKGPYNINLNESGVEEVQRWVNGSENNGIFLINDGGDTLGLRSSEYNKTHQRPRLNITYSIDSTNNELPTAEFSFAVNALDVDFTDNSSDADGSIVSWAWEFGDNQVSELQNPSHNFDSEGSFNVKLTVTDLYGATDTTTKTIIVSNQTNPITVSLQQGLNNYTGTKDTYVVEGLANSNYGNDSLLLADGNDGHLRRELISLLKWDLSSIPTNATVSSASITLQIESTTDHHYNLLEMQAPWTENSATWNNSQPESNRGVIAAKFTPTSRGPYTFLLNSAGISVIQNWLNGQANHGFTIESNGTSDGIDMRSSEYRTIAKRPKLTITYQ